MPDCREHPVEECRVREETSTLNILVRLWVLSDDLLGDILLEDSIEEGRDGCEEDVEERDDPIVIDGLSPC